MQSVSRAAGSVGSQLHNVQSAISTDFSQFKSELAKSVNKAHLNIAQYIASRQHGTTFLQKLYVEWHPP
jgi:hypothetical protein